MPMIYYLVARRHAHTMHDFLAGWGKPLADRIRVVSYHDLFSGVTKRLPEATYVFTSLGGDMGARNPPSRMRQRCSNIHRRLVQAYGPDRVLNDPGNFLSRTELLHALRERGINRFAAFRPDKDVPPRFPVFLRRASGTLWQTPELLHNRDDYAAAVRGAGKLDGLLAVEYCDTAGGSGIYRKYACFIVGERVVPRHLLFSRNWWVKQADLAEPGMLREELGFIESNPHAPLLREVARLAGLSYGRIDYALLDGQPQIWEMNITPALVTDPAADVPARRAVHEKFVELFAQALDAVDRPAA